MTLTTTLPLANFGNFWGPDTILIFFLFVPCTAFFIWMLIDCATNETNEGNTKIVWLLIVLLAPLGSLIYFFARKLNRPSLKS